MDEPKRIVIGTRGSTLALKQADIVKAALYAHDPSIGVEIKIIKTEGDVNFAPIPLDTIGKGWFTKEIEKELLEGSIDIAVHSLKDLPEEFPKGLHLAAYLNREDPRDVLISRENKKLSELETGARIGTDSQRRKVQILALRNDVVVESIRGNVLTRLEKLDVGDYDAVVLAAAGIIRLGLANRITEYFSSDEITPAPGQGILAVESRESDSATNELMEHINDASVMRIALAERSFSSALDGGCKTPLGACATISGDTLTLLGMVADESGRVKRERLEGPADTATTLGAELAKRFQA